MTSSMPKAMGRSNSGSYCYVSTGYRNAHSNMQYLYYYQTATGPADNICVMPEIDVTNFPMNNNVLTFYAHSSQTGDWASEVPLIVGLMTDPDSMQTFLPWDTVMVAINLEEDINTTEIQYVVDFSGYQGPAKYIAMNFQRQPGTSYIYLDDVLITTNSTCGVPHNVHTTAATPSTISVEWSDTSNATRWQVEWGLRDFIPGTGFSQDVTGTSFTIQNLRPNTHYDIYVRAYCTATELSSVNWTVCHGQTTQIPGPLPYYYDFEDANEWNNWNTLSNTGQHWMRGTFQPGQGNYSMYHTTDGIGYSPYSFDRITNSVAWRDIDLGDIDSSYKFTMLSRAGGNIVSYDGLIMLLEDGSHAYDYNTGANITSPWGYINSLYNILDVRRDTVWKPYSATFDNTHGIKHVIFYWFNQSTSYAGIWYQAAAVDSVRVYYDPCPRPVDVVCDYATPTAATLSWRGATQGEYEVIYRPYGAAASMNRSARTNSNTITLTGLSRAQRYYCWVRKICGGDTSLLSDYIVFSTKYCSGPWEITPDADGEWGTAYQFPVYTTSAYSLSQFIIDSADIGPGEEMDFHSIEFMYGQHSRTDSLKRVRIYLTNSAKKEFMSSSDFTVVSDSDLVYTGPMYCAQNIYNVFPFDSVWHYNGTGNVIVTVFKDLGGSHVTDQYRFRTRYSNGKFKTVYSYSSSNSINPKLTPPGGTYGISGYRPAMHLVSCGNSRCPVPQINPTTDITYTSAKINWMGDGAHYEVAVKPASVGSWPEGVVVDGIETTSNQSYTATGLLPGTTYQIRIRNLCDSVTVSDYEYDFFETPELPCLTPTNLTKSDVTFDGATFDWTPGENETAWKLHVWNTTFDTVYNVSAHPYTAHGLKQNLSYYAAVSAVCLADIRESDYSDTIDLRTPVCPGVTNVNVSNVSHSHATISWTGNASSYTIEYGRRGFATGNGTRVNDVTETSYQIQDLRADYSYDVYVRANCDATNSSDWSEVKSFTTSAGIDDVDGGNVSIYPNPASNSTTITLNGVNGEVTIAVVDMNGRTVMSQTLTCEGDCSKKLEVKDLAQGAYFVRISGENVNTVRKLVVK